MPDSQEGQGGALVNMLQGCQGRVVKREAEMRCGAEGCAEWKASISSVEWVRLFTGSQLLWPLL